MNDLTNDYRKIRINFWYGTVHYTTMQIFIKYILHLQETIVEYEAKSYIKVTLTEYYFCLDCFPWLIHAKYQQLN